VWANDGQVADSAATAAAAVAVAVVAALVATTADVAVVVAFGGANSVRLPGWMGGSFSCSLAALPYRFTVWNWVWIMYN